MSAAKNKHNNKEAAKILIELQSKTEDETLMDYRRQLLQNSSSEADQAQYKFPDQMEPSMWPWAYPNPPLVPFNPGALPFYPACLPNSTPAWFPPCLEPGKYNMPPAFHGMDFQHGLTWPAAMCHGLFDPSHPSRRRRTKFTEEQLAVLEKTFTQGSKFPSPGERMRLEARTGLSKEKISVWFQNRRAKDKREKSHEETIKETEELIPASEKETEHDEEHLRICSEAKQQQECETEYEVAETSNVELDEQESKQEVGQKRLHEHEEDSPYENNTSKSKVIYLEQLEPEQYKFSDIVNEDDAIHDVDTRDVGTSIEAGDVADDGRAYPYRPQVLKGNPSKRRKLFTAEAEKTDNNKQHFSSLEYRIFGET